MATINKCVGVLLLVVVMQVLSSRSAEAQTLYPTEVMRYVFSEMIYSANGQYRIRWACGSGQCTVIQDEYSGGWTYRAHVFGGGMSQLVAPRLENYGGNIIMFDQNNNFGEQSDTYGSGNWLNIQDDGNIVVYDPSNNPLWTPVCELPTFWWAFPFGGTCP